MGTGRGKRSGVLLYCRGQPVEEGPNGVTVMEAMINRFGGDYAQLFNAGCVQVDYWAPTGGQTGWFSIDETFPQELRSEAEEAIRRWFKERGWALGEFE